MVVMCSRKGRKQMGEQQSSNKYWYVVFCLVGTVYALL